MDSQNDQKFSQDSRPPLQQQVIPAPICWSPQNESQVAQVLPPVELIQGRYHVIYDGAAGGQQASVTPSPQSGGNS